MRTSLVFVAVGLVSFTIVAHAAAPGASKPAPTLRPTAVPRKALLRPDPPLNVLSWNLAGTAGALVGEKVIVEGRDFDPARVLFRLQYDDGKAVTFRPSAASQANRLEATVPPNAASDLEARFEVVTPNGIPHVLAESFRVADGIRIASVSPPSLVYSTILEDEARSRQSSKPQFSMALKDRRLVVEGVGVDRLRLVTLRCGTGGDHSGCIDLGQDLLLKVAEVGKATFLRREFELPAVVSLPGGKESVPTTRPLRFEGHVGPALRIEPFVPAPLAIQEVRPKRWGISPAPFVLLGDSAGPMGPSSLHDNMIELVGTSTSRATYRIGSVPAGRCSGADASCWLTLPPSAATGPVCGTADGKEVCSAPITVLSPVRITKGPGTAVPGPGGATLTEVTVRTDLVIEGFDLLPSVPVTDLSYTFGLPVGAGEGIAAEACNLAFRLVSHEKQRIVFRFGEPNGPVDPSCTPEVLATTRLFAKSGATVGIVPLELVAHYRGNRRVLVKYSVRGKL